MNCNTVRFGTLLVSGFAPGKEAPPNLGTIVDNSNRFVEQLAPVAAMIGLAIEQESPGNSQGDVLLRVTGPSKEVTERELAESLRYAGLTVKQFARKSPFTD